MSANLMGKASALSEFKRGLVFSLKLLVVAVFFSALCIIGFYFLNKDETIRALKEIIPELIHYQLWIGITLLIVLMYKGCRNVNTYYKRKRLMNEEPFMGLIEKGFERQKLQLVNTIDSKEIRIEWDRVYVSEGEGYSKHAIIIKVLNLKIDNPGDFQRHYQSNFENELICYKDHIEYQIPYGSDRPNAELIIQRATELVRVCLGFGLDEVAKLSE